MELHELCLEFIKDFYWVTIYSNTIYSDGGEIQIVFHDCSETPKTKKVYYMGTILGFPTYIAWDKAEYITGINILSKENSVALKELMKRMKNTQTISFFKYVIDNFEKNQKRMSFKLNELKEEFPYLFLDSEEIIS